MIATFSFDDQTQSAIFALLVSRPGAIGTKVNCTQVSGMLPGDGHSIVPGSTEHVWVYAQWEQTPACPAYAVRNDLTSIAQCVGGNRICSSVADGYPFWKLDHGSKRSLLFFGTDSDEAFIQDSEVKADVDFYLGLEKLVLTPVFVGCMFTTSIKSVFTVTDPCGDLTEHSNEFITTKVMEAFDIYSRCPARRQLMFAGKPPLCSFQSWDDIAGEEPKTKREKETSPEVIEYNIIGDIRI